MAREPAKGARGEWQQQQHGRRAFSRRFARPHAAPQDGGGGGGYDEWVDAASGVGLVASGTYGRRGWRRAVSGG